MLLNWLWRKAEDGGSRCDVWKGSSSIQSDGSGGRFDLSVTGDTWLYTPPYYFPLPSLLLTTIFLF